MPILIIIEAILAISLIIAVLLQPSKSDGFKGLIIGNTTETFMSKNKSVTRENFLIKVTAVIFVLFCINTILLTVIK